MTKKYPWLKFFSILAIYFTIMCSVKAQTYLLLDRRWYKPAIEVDSVTRENLSNGLFPVYKEDLDTLITLLSKFKNLKTDGLTRKFYYSEDFKTERFEFAIENIKRTYGDGYEINLISKGTFGKPTLKLSDPRNNLPANEKVIKLFLAYLEKTKENISKPVDKRRSAKNNPLNN